MYRIKSRLWCDHDFPANNTSVTGKDPEKLKKKRIDVSNPPNCRCGFRSVNRVVKLETPNKGRSYVVCATRRCKYFEWVDRENKWSKNYQWKRFLQNGYVLVSDFGFRASDLKQGGVGDCWFLAAIAVVAERHDLIAKLFVETNRNESDTYGMRYFLDGEWVGTVIDGRLPTIKNARRADETGLAFARTKSKQLWVSIIEKGYAKLHGSYFSISGGWVEEAMLDLTGAPVHTIDFSHSKFNVELFWRQLLYYKRMRFPMGCGTEQRGDLRNVGLVGCHAYSIMDVREIFDPALEHGSVKLLRVRNPWGRTQYTGTWSDKSAEWTQLLNRHKEIERSDEDDGLFWIDLTHFLMGFSSVDVCFARLEKDGYHARSFSNMFPLRKSKIRTCRDAYVVHTKVSSILHVMALQPTGRGRWCRDDRKVSYKPGDISVLILRRENKKGERYIVEELSMRGGGEVHRRSVAVHLEPNVTYYVVFLNPGTTPAAAEKRKFQPFKVRFVCNEPVRVTPFAFDMKKHAKIVLSALHDSLFRPRITRNYAKLHEELLLSRIYCEFSRKRLGTSQGVEIWSFRSASNVFLIAARNTTKQRVSVKLQLHTKVGAARCSRDLGESLLKPDPKLSKIAQDKEEEEKKKKKENMIVKHRWQPRSRKGFRVKAKWRVYNEMCSVEPRSECVLMIVSGTSRMCEIGKCEFQIFEKTKRIDTTIYSWLGENNEMRSCLFESLPLVDHVVSAHSKEDEDLKRALEASRQIKIREEEDLKRALEASCQSKNREEEELKRALKVSLQDHHQLMVKRERKREHRSSKFRKVVVDLCGDGESTKIAEIDLCGDDDDDDGIVEVVIKNDEVTNTTTTPTVSNIATPLQRRPDKDTLRTLRLKRFQK